MTVTIKLSPYNPSWPQIFEKEAAKIKNQLNQLNIEGDLYHVGSTSVPGLIAKPKIDIILAVQALEHFDQVSALLKKLKYEEKGELNIPFRLFFMKEGPLTGFNLHLYEADNPDIELNFSFQHYLRTSPEAREEYAALKEQLIQSQLSDPNPQGLNGYTLGKDGFIRKALTATHFDKPCIRFASHYKEWEKVAEMQQQYFANHDAIHPEASNMYCFVFYKGIEIIGYAYFNNLSETQSECIEFVIDAPQTHLTDHFLKLCQKWFQWKDILVSFKDL